MKKSAKYFQSNNDVKKSMNTKIIDLVKKLHECIIKDIELDEKAILELESLGFKIHPPSSYPNR